MDNDIENKLLQLYFIQCGSKRKAKEVLCLTCKRLFLTRLDWNQKFCSKECRGLSSKKQLELECSCCNKKFFRTLSKVLSSKNDIFFCSRECKLKTQSIHSLNPVSKVIRPAHYGTGNDYILHCKKIKKWECLDVCSNANILYLLCVHHIDGNRKNNPLDGSNWLVLCQNCHAKRHLKQDKSGKWRYSTKSLTPRDRLKLI